MYIHTHILYVLFSVQVVLVILMQTHLFSLSLFLCFCVCAVGKPKSHVVAACRQAIKDNDCDSLIKVIKFGKV